MFCNQRHFRWWCVETASSMPETSTRCSAASKSTTPLQSVSPHVRPSLLLLPGVQRFFYSDEFAPLADEKPAGVENTFLLCPAPVVDEVGKYVAASLYSNKHLALLARFHVQLGSRSFHTQKHMFGYVRLWPQGTRSLPYISFFYNLATFHICNSQHSSAEWKRLSSCSSIICPASVLHGNRQQVRLWECTSDISSN